mgnify:FL=1
MLVPLSWLKEYVDIDVEAKELEEKLFSCGFEVEESYEVGKDISGVVVGLVEECEPIPETHLHVCKVNVGGAEPLQICCGADNVHAGGKYPVALEGAQVYATAKDHVTIEGTMKIKKGKLRGYESCGMLCSGTELGLNEDLYPGAGYNGLLVLPEDAEVGADVKPLLQLDDWIFDIAITANRPDCESIFGIAREVAAILNKPVKTPALDYTESGITKDGFTVTVDAPDLCPRYIAHYVTDVKIGESPAWMKRRLALVGIGSISNVVDITNYILKELGQPMHAFDSSYIEGNVIHVRRAHDKEKIVTLDEKEFELNENNLVICDAEKPVCLAGIMGGANSGMDENTTSLLFECATFARDSVRKTSRALGQNSDSSARYEKGVDRHSPELGLARALHLIQELDCGDITTLEFDLTDGRPIERKHIVTTPAKICGVLGITVPDQTMIDILRRLEFTVDVQADGSWDVSAPLYREDVDGFPDLAEEVIREYGYDHIVPTFLNTAAVTNGGLNYEQKQQLKTKRLLAAQGFYEASTLAFYSNAELDMLHIPEDDVARKAIRILNPISENLSIMRTLLTPSMLNVIVDNLKKGNNEGRLFEMAPVYLAKELPINEHPHERQTLCIGAFGPEEDFFTVKGAMEALAAGFGLSFEYKRESTPWLHPGISAAVYCNGKRLGVFGKLSNEINGELEIAKEQKDSQNIYLGELDYEALMSCVDGELRYQPLSPYASVKRDLALVCDEAVTCGEIEETIKKASPLITEVKLFDIYRGANLGEGKKSMAFSLTLSDPAAEVSAEQVERTVKKVLGNLKFKLGIEIR